VAGRLGVDTARQVLDAEDSQTAATLLDAAR
jgi:hypothetical protein